jgi:hypothetical protein
MPLAEKGVRGKAAGLAPPQHTETRITYFVIFRR